VPDTKEAEIESFAPEWMWEACHDHDGIMMLHIMLADGITDPRNASAFVVDCVTRAQSGTPFKNVVDLSRGY
jgi:hypothetical protein